MKAVILAGGLGSRLAEETDLKPKPMVEVGGKPILWHILSLFVLPEAAPEHDSSWFGFTVNSPMEVGMKQGR